MEEESKKQLWSMLNMLRNTHPIRDLKLFEVFAELKGEEELKEIVSDNVKLNAFTESYSMTPSIFVYNFINALYKDLHPKNTLEPWMTISSPSLLLSFINVFGYCRFPNELERVELIFPKNDKNFLVGDILKENGKFKSEFDLILSFPPIGMKIPREYADFPSLEYITNLILKCKEFLSKKGKIILLAPNSLFVKDSEKELILSNGLCFDAIFSISSGAFSPQTNIAVNLIIIEQGIRDNTFVAEISSDEKTNQVVLENYKSRKTGKTIQLGSLVNISEFKTLRTLIADKETIELAKRMGFPPIPLDEIKISINALKKELPEDVEHLPNSFYLPKIGNSPAVSNVSSMKIKPTNYYQIQLDEYKASAIYLASFFNSEIGKKIRNSLEVGVIRQIPKSQLTKCIVYLPDIPTQSKIIELDSKLDQFSLRLEEFKRNLWKQPKNHNSFSKELKNINKEEKLENWIDTLPFPISSILWRYYATKEKERKIEHLFHFFEAFSEFLSMIMLSALVQDKEFYKLECHKWIDTDEKFREWYLKASFGSWNYLTARLSKAIREYLSDKDKIDFCRNLFGNPNDVFFNIITSKGIIRILNEVNELRNKWKGHTGITSQEENTQRVLVLEQQLNEFRKYISDGFEDSRILIPTTNSYEDGVFTYTVKELIGARTPFNEITIKTTIPLDRKKLYIAHANQSKPIELIPFIKYVESSEAVYFYISIESKNVRWVSYHFDKESELKQPADNNIFRVFNFLKSEN